MGIVIAHEPIAMPLIASYATGVGRARERERQRQLDMQKEYDRMRHRTSLQYQQQNWAATENALDRANRLTVEGMRGKENEKDFERDKEMWNIRDESYRRRDDIGRLWDDINEREKWMLGSPLTEEGRAKWADFSGQLQEFRKNGGNYRDGSMQQFLAGWLKDFDAANPDAWIERPPAPMDDIRSRGVFRMPDGTLRPASEYDGSEGGILMMPNRHGEWDRVDTDGGGKTDTVSDFPSSQQFFADDKRFDATYQRARSELMEKYQEDLARAGKDGEKPPMPTDEDIKKRMQELYDIRRGMATPPKPDARNAALQEGGSSAGEAPPVKEGGSPMSTARGPQPDVTAVVEEPEAKPKDISGPEVPEDFTGMYAQNAMHYYDPWDQPKPRYLGPPGTETGEYVRGDDGSWVFRPFDAGSGSSPPMKRDILPQEGGGMPGGKRSVLPEEGGGMSSGKRGLLPQEGGQVYRPSAAADKGGPTVPKTQEEAREAMQLWNAYVNAKTPEERQKAYESMPPAMQQEIDDFADMQNYLPAL